MKITITKTTAPKTKPDSAKLGFGKYFTDHMFIMDYTEGQGWHDARIEPYHDLSLSPASMVFHYAQEMFEGLKAYRAADGRTLLFRPNKNIERMNNTNRRLCIPQIDPDDALQAIVELVRTDIDWVPTEKDTSLYIRPFIIATDPFLGVHPSKTYKFIIILSPVGSYYAAGLDPVKICVEDEYVRAVKGGMGFAKTGGNYAASILAGMNAKHIGYAQVLWLDGVHQRYIEEVGAMNMMFVYEDRRIVTPALNGSILPGITRDSVLKLGKHLGYETEEARMDIHDVIADIKAGRVTEAFGTGTAAVVSPVNKIRFQGEEIGIGDGGIGHITQQLYDVLTGIQFGKTEDPMGWVVHLK